MFSAKELAELVLGEFKEAEQKGCRCCADEELAYLEKERRKWLEKVQRHRDKKGKPAVKLEERCCPVCFCFFEVALHERPGRLPEHCSKQCRNVKYMRKVRGHVDDLM